MMVGWMGEERDTVSGNGWVVSNKRPSITQGTQDTHVARAPTIGSTSAFIFLLPTPSVTPRLSLFSQCNQEINSNQPKNIAVPN